MNKIKILNFIFFICLNLFLISCGTHSVEDYEEEGQSVIRSLVQELKKIHTRAQLEIASQKIQKHFDRLVDIMIVIQEINQNSSINQKNTKELIDSSHELNDQLRLELNRLYHLNGGKQIIERCQEKALHRLDAFEKKQIKI